MEVWGITNCEPKYEKATLVNPSAYGPDYLKAVTPSTTSDELRDLAKSNDKIVRSRVAEHSNTPEDVLRDLFAEFPEVVAENPSAPEDVLRKAARSTSTELRVAAAVNCSTPLDELVKLFDDADEIVREEVKENFAERNK